VPTFRCSSAFTVILERIEHRDHAGEVARKILDTLREPIALGVHGQSVAVTASIGIAVYPQDASETEELIRHADAAMFAAKEQGRNRIQSFTCDLDERMSNRVLLESELRKVTDGGQLRLHYQPQFAGGNPRIVAVEALLRWQHPLRGLLQPSEFLHVAEDSGLILQLGLWVLREACRQGRRWHEQGHPLRIAVNVSPRQLGLPAFVEELAAVLRESGLPPGALELEITEDTLMVGAHAVTRRLHELRTLGVQVAIDDFGTGHSSLGRLRRLPVSRLKIDGCFVQGIPHSQDDRAVASAIISMAHDLSLEVVAVGVESDEQRAFLEACGSDLLQGYWLGRPVPAETIDALLATP